MLLLGYVLCDVFVMKTLNTPGMKGDSAQLCCSDKIAGGRSTLVLVFKLTTKSELESTVFKIDVNDDLSWR